MSTRELLARAVLLWPAPPVDCTRRVEPSRGGPRSGSDLCPVSGLWLVTLPQSQPCPPLLWSQAALSSASMTCPVPWGPEDWALPCLCSLPQRFKSSLPPRVLLPPPHLPPRLLSIACPWTPCQCLCIPLDLLWDHRPQSSLQLLHC